MRPEVNAVATIIIAVVSAGVVAGSLLIARNERLRAAEIAAAQRA
jgi:putrescine transport system permease protein